MSDKKQLNLFFKPAKPLVVCHRSSYFILGLFLKFNIICVNGLQSESPHESENETYAYIHELFLFLYLL